MPARGRSEKGGGKAPEAKRTKGEVGGARPTPAECRLATKSLAALHPEVLKRIEDRARQRKAGGRTVADDVVATMLSQNTTDANSRAAFAGLKAAFPKWEDVANPKNVERVEAAIRVAGLAKTRSQRMQEMLSQIMSKTGGDASMAYIRDLDDAAVKAELSTFKGMGPKTISCVLLFGLGRAEFPVDTHVLRIAKQLNWIPEAATRESAYEHLNASVPRDVKLNLHCLLVSHGKHCHRCAANGKPQFPPDSGIPLDCPLAKHFELAPVRGKLRARTGSERSKGSSDITTPASKRRRGAKPAEAVSPSRPPDLMSHTVAMLVEMCKSRGLPHSGTKAERVARIEMAMEMEKTK
eukprot:Hpha_TRINITY_DN16792_c2_g6::TRINITY_DN16792_c2_g6_i1::g.77274::m.77274/K10773/NTH; endonuclease III